jgi:hypothetical protein
MAVQPEKRKPQIKREWLTDAQWNHMDQVLFPLLKRLKAKAQARMAELERGQ